MKHIFSRFVQNSKKTVPSLYKGVLFSLVIMSSMWANTQETFASCTPRTNADLSYIECTEVKDDQYTAQSGTSYEHDHFLESIPNDPVYGKPSTMTAVEVEYLNSTPRIDSIDLYVCPGGNASPENMKNCTLLTTTTSNRLNYRGENGWGLNSGTGVWQKGEEKFFVAVVFFHNFASKEEMKANSIVESRTTYHYINGQHDKTQSIIKHRFTEAPCTGDNCIPDKPDCSLTPNAPECLPTVDCSKTPNDPKCLPTVDCTKTPNDPKCNPTVDCTKTPNDPKCKPTPDCTKTPNAPECQNCTTNPNLPGCVPNCTTNPNLPGCVPNCTTNPNLPGCVPNCTTNPNLPGCGGTTPNCTTNPSLPGCGGGGGSGSRYCGDGHVNPQDGEQCDIPRSSVYELFRCNGVSCMTLYNPPSINNPTVPLPQPSKDGCDKYCKLIPTGGGGGGTSGCSGNDCVCITYTINQDQKVRGNNQEATYTVTVENKSSNVHVGPIDIAHEMWRNNDKPDKKQGFILFKDLSGLVSALRKVGNFPTPGDKAGGRIELDKLDPGQKYTFTFKGQAKAFQSGYALKDGVQQADVTAVIRAYTSQKTGEVKEVDRDYATMVVSRSVVLTRNSGNVFANSPLGYIADIQETIVKYTGNATGFHNFTGVILGEIGMAGDTLVSAYIYRGTEKQGFSTGTGRDEYFIRIINEIPKITRNIRGGSGTQANSNADLEKLGTRPDNAKIFVAQNGLTIGGSLTEDIKANLVPTMEIEGRKTIIIENGDLTINQNIAYKAIPADVVSKEAIPSIAFIVKSGNIYIHPGVTELSGLYMVGDTGKFFSTQNLATSNVVPKPLTIEGMVIGNVEELLKARAYIGDVVRDANGKVTTIDKEGSVVIKHDARIYSYPPPGISDILRGGVEKGVK